MVEYIEKLIIALGGTISPGRGSRAESCLRDPRFSTCHILIP